MANPINHYENFPVATWLCPEHLRPAVVAIYHFARTADDIADEGDAHAEQRLERLQQYRAALALACQAEAIPLDTPWFGIMQALQVMIKRHQLPTQPLHDLITAFERDVAHSAQGAVYAYYGNLLDYCRYSANPVGRLMLHLYGVTDAVALQHSDAICTALQLYNFWQDISVDVARGRYYLPQDLCSQYGVDPKAPMQAGMAARQALLYALLDRADATMQQGASLPRHVQQQAGRLAAWELRLVIQGGQRIGQKTRALRDRAFYSRPTIGASDVVPMLWNALRGV